MNRRRNTVIIVVVVIVLLCCCAATVAAAVVGLGLIPWRSQTSFSLDLDDIVASGIEAAATQSQRFAVEGRPLLDIDCPICDVEISGGPGSEVVVEATTHTWAAQRSAAEQGLDRIRVSFDQAGDEITVRVDMPAQTRWPGMRARVDLEISVPGDCDVRLDLDIANVDVRDVRGDIEVRADVGEVNLRDVAAREQLTVRTDVARVRLEGPISDGARYDIRTTVGEIALNLPSDSSFELDAESNVGSVTTEFDVEATREPQQFVGGRIEGTVGEAPTAQLRLQSELGSIRVDAD